jgi:hypothetical protein
MNIRQHNATLQKIYGKTRTWQKTLKGHDNQNTILALDRAISEKREHNTTQQKDTTRQDNKRYEKARQDKT